MFDRETKQKARNAYRLLVLDGHGSHLSRSFIEYCDSNRILLAIYPPHSTHTLQPLDVCLFSPLATAYSNELQSFMTASMGFSSLSKRDFFRLFWTAWHQAITRKNILSGFEKCGLSPFNPHRILARFNTETTSRPSSSESSRSVLSAGDWKRIDQLLRQAVSDIRDQEAQRLSHTIHSLAMKNMLLQQENQRLTIALQDKKKKRKPQKPLLLEPREQYDGGALFYSPNKVQQARERQVEKDALAERNRQVKQDNLKRKTAEKAEKAALVTQRKLARQAARDIRLQQAEEKRLQKEEAILATQANRQLESDLKASKKTQKARKAPRASPASEQQAIVVVEGPVAIEPQNRRGRAIKLPTRFRE